MRTPEGGLRLDSSASLLVGSNGMGRDRRNG